MVEMLNCNEMSIRGGGRGFYKWSSPTYSNERYVKDKVGAGEEGRKRKAGETERATRKRGRTNTSPSRAHWTAVQFNSVQSGCDVAPPGKKDGHLHILHAYRNQAIVQLPQCRSTHILSFKIHFLTMNLAGEYRNQG
jgi:hypothetical protein